eukprot:Pgem_evm1s16561
MSLLRKTSLRFSSHYKKTKQPQPKLRLDIEVIRNVDSDIQGIDVGENSNNDNTDTEESDNHEEVDLSKSCPSVYEEGGHTSVS